EIGDLISHLLHDLNIACVLRIDQWPDVKAAYAGVAIIAGARVVLVNDIAELQEEFRKLRGLDRAIFDKGDRLPLPFHSKKKPEPGLPNLPNACLQRGVESSNVRISEIFTFKRGFHGVEFGS